MIEFGITNVSAGRLGGLFGLNRTDSGLVGLFGRDPAAAGFPPHTPNIMFNQNLLGIYGKV
jgi:hypothetical protein